MKQTTLEWLEKEITKRITRRNPHDTIIIQTQGSTLVELFEQAKEIEKDRETKIKELETFLQEDIMDDLIKLFREIHESEHKIWFTFEEIEEIIKKYNENVRLQN